MSVKIYQGSVKVSSVSTFNIAIDALFEAAGYAVTTDVSSRVITVKNGGAIFGLQTITLSVSEYKSNAMSTTYNLIVDADQRTLIVVTSIMSWGTKDSTFSENYTRVAIVANGRDIWAGTGNSAYQTKDFWNVPDISFSRTSGQPVVLTVAVDYNTRAVDAPIFVCANGIVYPLGTIIQDGSAKFVSDGNGLAIRVKE